MSQYGNYKSNFVKDVQKQITKEEIEKAKKESLKRELNKDKEIKK